MNNKKTNTEEKREIRVTGVNSRLHDVIVEQGDLNERSASAEVLFFLKNNYPPYLNLKNKKK